MVVFSSNVAKTSVCQCFLSQIGVQELKKPIFSRKTHHASSLDQTFPQVQKALFLPQNGLKMELKKHFYKI